MPSPTTTPPRPSSSTSSGGCRACRPDIDDRAVRVADPLAAERDLDQLVYPAVRAAHRRRRSPCSTLAGADARRRPPACGCCSSAARPAPTSTTSTPARVDAADGPGGGRCAPVTGCWPARPTCSSARSPSRPRDYDVAAEEYERRGRRRSATSTTRPAWPRPCARGAWPASSPASSTEAEQLLDEADALYEAARRPRGHAWVDQHRAWIAFVQGDLELADARLHEAAETFEEMGDGGGLGWTMGLLAWVRFQQGRLDEAEALAADVAREAGLRGERWAQAMMWVLLAALRLWRGHAESSLTLARQARDIFRELNDRWGELQALVPMSRALVALGRSRPRPSRWPRAAMALGRAHEHAGPRARRWSPGWPPTSGRGEPGGAGRAAGRRRSCIERRPGGRGPRRQGRPGPRPAAGGPTSTRRVAVLDALADESRRAPLPDVGRGARAGGRRAPGRGRRGRAAPWAAAWRLLPRPPDAAAAALGLAAAQLRRRGRGAPRPDGGDRRAPTRPTTASPRPSPAWPWPSASRRWAPTTPRSARADADAHLDALDLAQTGWRVAYRLAARPTAVTRLPPDARRGPAGSAPPRSEAGSRSVVPARSTASGRCRTTSTHGWAAACCGDGADLGQGRDLRSQRRLPAEVEELPALRGDGQVPVLVELLGAGAEVELAGCGPRCRASARRHGQVDPGHERSRRRPGSRAGARCGGRSGQVERPSRRRSNQESGTRCSLVRRVEQASRSSPGPRAARTVRAARPSRGASAGSCHDGATSSSGRCTSWRA